MGLGPDRIIRAVGAKSANERISFVREGNDSLLVTNRTPTCSRFLHRPRIQSCSVSGRYPQTYWFLSRPEQRFHRKLCDLVNPTVRSGREANVTRVTLPTAYAFSTTRRGFLPATLLDRDRFILRRLRSG